MGGKEKGKEPDAAAKLKEKTKKEREEKPTERSTVSSRSVLSEEASVKRTKSAETKSRRKQSADKVEGHDEEARKKRKKRSRSSKSRRRGTTDSPALTSRDDADLIDRDTQRRRLEPSDAKMTKSAHSSPYPSRRQRDRDQIIAGEMPARASSELTKKHSINTRLLSKQMSLCEDLKSDDEDDARPMGFISLLERADVEKVFDLRSCTPAEEAAKPVGFMNFIVPSVFDIGEPIVPVSGKAAAMLGLQPCEEAPLSPKQDSKRASRRLFPRARSHSSGTHKERALLSRSPSPPLSPTSPRRVDAVLNGASTKIRRMLGDDSSPPEVRNVEEKSLSQASAKVRRLLGDVQGQGTSVSEPLISQPESKPIPLRSSYGAPPTKAEVAGSPESDGLASLTVGQGGIDEDSKSRTKLMQMMGLGENDLKKAEEHTAKLMVKQTDGGSKWRKKFRKKAALDPQEGLEAHEKRAYKKLRETPQVTGEIADAMQSCIAACGLRPPAPEVFEEPRSLVHILANDFKKQGRSRWTERELGVRKSKGRLDLLLKEVGEKKAEGEAVPMGLGLMHIEFDRFWTKTKFAGTVYFAGCFYGDQREVITEYLHHLHQSLMGTITNGTADSGFHKSALKYVQEVTQTSNLKSLERAKPLATFNGQASFASSGFNSIALVSGLGEMHIAAARSAYSACCAIASQPDDWRGMFTIEKLLGRRVYKVFCGLHFFIAITDIHEVVTWGDNANPRTGDISGHLGFKNTRYSMPRIISGFSGRPLHASGGAAHVAILTTEGIYTCGSNEMGQLGHEEVSDGVPSRVSGITDRFGVNCVVSTVSCGLDHTLVSTEDGFVFSWGANHYGQLGLETTVHFVRTATRVDCLSDVISVQCGATHSVVLQSHGSLITFGSNSFGELGCGDITTLYSHKPVVVNLSQCDEATFGFPVSITAGAYTSGCVTNQGVVYSWGMLQSENFTKHCYQPRLLTNLVEEHLFIVGYESGISHFIYRTDESLSRAVANLYHAFTADLERENWSDFYNGLVRDLQQLPHPERTFPLVHSRVRAWTVGRSPGRVPRVSSSKCFMRLGTESNFRSVLADTFLVTNQSDYRVTVTIEAANKVENLKQQVLVDPSCFKLSKKGSRQVRLTFITTRALVDEVAFVVVVTARKGDQEVCASLIFCQVHGSELRRASLADPDSFNETHYVKALSTYVPSVVLREFTENPNPPIEPRIVQFPASILFLDISGFTSLNERLAQLGRAGPELVSKHINSYFASLIQVVSEHGGDVLKFAGDALICMFYDGTEPVEDKELATKSLVQLTLRAVQCGFDIQTRLAQYDSDEGFSLTLHIGIGSGDVLSLYVGSVNGSWEYLVSGEPLAQLRTAVDNSKSGEVVVSRESWELIKHRCEGEPRENDFFVQKITESVPVQPVKKIPGWPRLESEAALRCFTPLAVQATVDSQQLAGWGDELRVATVLFVKLNTHIPDDSNDVYLAAIDGILCCMQEVVFKYEGMVRQFLADDKGTVLIAAFGLPPFSHEDDPVRGVKTAMEIHEALQEKGMDCSIGVTTGQVFCGSVGCPQRQEYAMVGDIVNLSARLMVAAFKQNKHVLCDLETYDAAEAAIAFEPLEPIMVKGKSKPIAIFRPHNATVGVKHLRITNRYVERAAPLIARVLERKAIEDHIMYLNTGNLRKDVGAVIIEGQQGMGKTRLVHYAASLCKFTDIQICHGAADMIQKTTALYAWRTVLSDLLGLTVFGKDEVVESKETILAKLASELEGVWFDYVPLLNGLIPVSIPDNDLTSSLNRKEKDTYLAALVKHIITNAALKHSVLLMLEDIQWMDLASLSLAVDVVLTVPSVFVILTARSLSGLPLMDNVLDLPNVQRFKLSALLPEESAALARSVLDVQELPEQVHEVLSKAQGNPMFCEEIALGLLDSGAVVIKDGRCEVVGNLDEIELSAVTAVIMTRLDRLGSDRQMVLKVASAIGFRFDLATLVEVFPIEKSEKKFIPAELETLERQGFVKQTCDQPRRESYQFTSVTILEVAYGRLTFAQRAKLHLSIAERYETQRSTSSDEPPTALHPLIAYHLVEVVEGQKQPDTKLLLRATRYLRSSAMICSTQRDRKQQAVWWNAAVAVAAMITNENERSRIQQEMRLQGVSQGLLSVNSYFSEGYSGDDADKANESTRQASILRTIAGILP